MSKGDGYVISFDNNVPVSLQHLLCQVTTWDANEIDQHYCPCCHWFLDLVVFDLAQGISPLLRDSLGWPDTVHQVGCVCERCSVARERES
jgi:hypothetical protein